MTHSTLVIGAGPTGRNCAFLLASAGHPVALVSRRGGQGAHPRITHIAADASDARALASIAQGVKTIINCAMPAYDRWPEEFPPIASAVLHAAKAAGADVVTLSNIYGYGRFSGPLTEDTPLAPHTVKGRVRAAMWDAALRSGLRVTEVRASDYLGQGAVTYFSLFALPGALKGEVSRFPTSILRTAGRSPRTWRERSSRLAHQTRRGAAPGMFPRASRPCASWPKWPLPRSARPRRSLRACRVKN
jgi:nucleoside-diphosphate-sugar epimerase